MALQQKGVIDSIGAMESRQYKDRTFVSRTLVLEQPSYDPYTGEKRNSNYLKFEATRDETCKALDNFSVGSVVEVEFIVRGSKYAKKDGSGDDVFTRLELRNIALASGASPSSANSGAKPIPAASPIQAPAPAPTQSQPQATFQEATDYDDELGF